MKLILTVLLLTVCAGNILAADSETESVITFLKGYRTALKKGEINSAIEMTAKFPEYPAAAIKEDTVRYSELSVSDELKLWIFPTSCKVVGDCAVVIVGDNLSPSADDPAYFLRQDGVWKIIPALTDWEDDYIELSEEERKSFGELTEHVEEQKSILRSIANPVVE